MALTCEMYICTLIFCAIIIIIYQEIIVTGPIVGSIAANLLCTAHPRPYACVEIVEA